MAEEAEFRRLENGQPATDGTGHAMASVLVQHTEQEAV